jgi:hypothetical protein
MVQAARVVRLALPVPTLLVLESVERTATGVALRVHGRSRRRPPCPSCSGSTVARHGYHERHLMDLPWLGCRVTLRLKLRRFRCGNAQCPRTTFVEQLPGFAVPRGRETLRLSQLVRRVGYAVGGRPGARLLAHCGVATSDDTVLRRVTAAPTRTNTVAVRVLGVDDWAWRRQQYYGTMLMDLEHAEPSICFPSALLAASPSGCWLIPVSKSSRGIGRPSTRTAAASARLTPFRSTTAITSWPTSLTRSKATFASSSCRQGLTRLEACSRAHLRESRADCAAARRASSATRPWFS